MKETLRIWLEKNPMCSRCKIRPHRKGSGWCSECRLIHEPVRWRRRPNGDGTICPRCGANSRCENHRYCNDCRNKSVREWRMRGGKYTLAQQAKKTTRHYINLRIKRGKIARQPCVYCQGTPTEFHHWSYEPRSLQGEFVCKLHHLMAELITKKLLTVFGSLV